jgi:hypothetical protein
LAAPSCSIKRLKDPQHTQDNEDEGNHKQRMDPIARLREAWNYVPAKKAEQPQDD